MLTEIEKPFNYNDSEADAFELTDSVLDDILNLNKDKIAARLTEFRCPEDYNKRATFLLKYMGVLGFGYCGGGQESADNDPKEKYDFVVEMFLRGDWTNKTHKYAMSKLGFTMKDLGYSKLGV